MSSANADNFDSRLNQAREKLRNHLNEKGLRSTWQRDEVLRVFMEQNGHASVDELYARLSKTHSSISHATIYRGMNLFVDAGIAKERRFNEGRTRYEPAINVSHHDHLVCLNCGDILEFEDPTIEKLQNEIAGKRGFLVQRHRLELYGLCSDCQSS